MPLAYCGMRWGEAIALRMRDVEFLRRRLTVTENAVQSVPAMRSARRRAARHAPPVPDFVLNELSKQCKGKAALVILSSGPATAGIRPRPKSHPAGGSPRAMKRAKVQAITPHDLRHSCASLSVSCGGECACAAADARAHVGEGHAGHLQLNCYDDDLDVVAVTLHGRYGPKPGHVGGARRKSHGAQRPSSETGLRRGWRKPAPAASTRNIIYGTNKGVGFHTREREASWLRLVYA